MENNICQAFSFGREKIARKKYMKWKIIFCQAFSFGNNHLQEWFKEITNIFNTWIIHVKEKVKHFYLISNIFRKERFSKTLRNSTYDSVFQ